MKMKEFVSKYLIWIIFIICLFLFFYIARLLRLDIITTFDDFVYGYVSKCIHPSITCIMKFITQLGNYIVMIPIVICFYLFNKDKSFNRYFTVNLVVVFVSNFICKNLFIRQRPSGINLITETGYSFPSGHSMISFAFYGFLAYYVYHCPINKYLKTFIICLLGLTIGAIGFSRIYLGVHYASDVLGGFLLACIYLIVFIKFIYKREKKITKRS